MSRQVILYCTGRGSHAADRVDLYTWNFTNDVLPDEFVRWNPVFKGETLTLGPCRVCGFSPDLGHDLGSRLVGELERQSRTVGRVEFDLSAAGI
jgi:hypothetical protein